MAPTGNDALILCAGLQSSGTTLISYCFLQRGDTDGVLDADNDLLPALDPQLARPVAWYKTTISSFRLSEIAQHYRDAGWDVRTLLVLRGKGNRLEQVEFRQGFNPFGRIFWNLRNDDIREHSPDRFALKAVVVEE